MTQGQRVNLGFSGSSFAADRTATVTVRGPNGTPVSQGSEGSPLRLVWLNGDSDLDLLATETGTYTLLVASTDAGTGSFTVTASAPLAPGALTPGVTKALTFGRVGQDVTLTYAGTVNQELSLDRSNNTTPYQPYVTVCTPSGAVLWQDHHPEHVDLPILPLTGTYTITFSTWSTLGAMNVLLTTRTPATTVSTT